MEEIYTSITCTICNKVITLKTKSTTLVLTTLYKHQDNDISCIREKKLKEILKEIR